MRGTFANVRLKNLLVPVREDGSASRAGAPGTCPAPTW